MFTYTTPSANALLHKYTALGYPVAQAWVLAVAEQELHRRWLDIYFAKREGRPSVSKIRQLYTRYDDCKIRLLTALAA